MVLLGHFRFFVFAIETQIMLQNLVSLVGFAMILWGFCKDQIEDKEPALVKMLG
jgi:protein-S-isoprenylcysteine O-methyltransferase Ste14